MGNLMMTNPRGNAELSEPTQIFHRPRYSESRPRKTCGYANDLRRWPMFSKLSPSFLESVRLYHVFEQQNGSNTFFVTQYDEVWAMGKNNDGCLGTGNDNPCSTPVEISALYGKNVQSFAHGDGHVLALTGKGEVYAWGNNGSFQVGKAEPMKIYIPALVYDGRGPALEIACGASHSACRTKKGDVYCWGWNYHGQIGTGNVVDQSTPRKVFGPIANLRCIGISCRTVATVAVFENGEVYVWGCNDHGNLGIGWERRCLVPAKVDFESNMIKKVASGFYYTLALTDDGSLYVWGLNTQGQLGLHCEDAQPKPIRHSGWRESHGRLIDIAACRYTSAAMTEDFKVLVWGYTRKNELRRPIEVYGESLQEAFAKMAPSFMTPVPVVRTPLVAQNSSSLTDWGRNLLNTLIEEFDKPTFSDVKFLLQSKIIHAHKVFLNVQSEYFRKMFQGPWMNSGGNAIEVTGSSYPVYKAFVRYFYTGDVELEVSDALELLELAAQCSEHALANLCQRRIEEMLSVENCASVYLVSVRSSHTELENSCMRFATDRLTAVTGTKAFAALPHDILPRFFSEVAKRGAFKS